jgi:hypothetical protein
MLLRQLVLKDYINKSMFDPKFEHRQSGTDSQSMNRTEIRAGDSVMTLYPENDGNKSGLTKFASVVEWNGWDGPALVRFSGQNQPVQVPGEWVGQKVVKAYKCAPDACLADWSCKEGSTNRENRERERERERERQCASARRMRS